MFGKVLYSQIFFHHTQGDRKFERITYSRKNRKRQVSRGKIDQYEYVTGATVK